MHDGQCNHCLTYRVLHSKRSLLDFSVVVIRLSQWLSTHLYFIFDCKMRRTCLKILGNGLFYHDSCRSDDCHPMHCTLLSKAEWYSYSLQHKMENSHESNPSSKQYFFPIFHFTGLDDIHTESYTEVSQEVSN